MDHVDAIIDEFGDFNDNVDPTLPPSFDDDPDSAPLYPVASITIGAFLFLLALFTNKYNLVGDAIEQLLSIIALALPDNHGLCTTLHEFKKYFKNLKNPLIHQHYCNNCMGIVEDQTLDKCPYETCNQPFYPKTSSYFLEIPLANQVRNLCVHHAIQQYYQCHFRNT